MLTALGIFFGPIMILAFVTEAIVHAVKVAKLEKRLEELEKELKTINSVPTFEEFNVEEPAEG